MKASLVQSSHVESHWFLYRGWYIYTCLSTKRGVLKPVCVCQHSERFSIGHSVMTPMSASVLLSQYALPTD